MIKQNRYLFFIFTAVCGILWGACKQEGSPCLTPTQVHLVVESMHKTTDTSTVFTDTTLSYARFAALSPNPIKYGYNPSSLFNITLSPNDTFCQWVFTTDTAETKKDTITLNYQPGRQFLSNACGYIYFYSLTSVSSTHNIIDSARINVKSVTNDITSNPKHVQIYIHPLY
ncbi:MAG: hypothetical protein JWQ38_3620 [Flavipsychrobacter sp.]|nr:hypothetical protein [Flavipsychrobacter sp.]